jgi:26S proteasome regulatory subunit N9
MSRQLARRQRSGEERLADDAFLAGTMEVTTLKVRKATAMAASGTPAAALDALLDECKREVEEGKAALDALPDGTEPSVAAAVHRASAEYFKLRGPAHAFYESALLFLGNTPLEALPAEERVSLAVDVALAALVGKGVYNFGEVNAHPLLVSLEGTPHAWLGELLRAFQHGDIDAFNATVAANREAFEAAPALISSAGAMKEKITLLAVMELAARKPSGERAIAFEEVAAEVRLPVEQVEWVLMRALSLGLIRGSIDEVGRSVAVSFVKPRVLDAAQIGVLRERVGAWRDKAGTMLQHMEEHTREIFK